MPNYYHYPIWVDDLVNDIKANPDNWYEVENNITYNIKYKDL
jgi:hypothetical protein